MTDLPDTPAFELKGRMTSLAVMRLFTPDLSVLRGQLRAQIERAPSLFRGAPLAIDVEDIAGAGLDLAGLLELVREHGLVPVAVRGADESLRAAAAEQRLGILEWSRGATTQAETAEDSKPKAPPRGASAAPARTPTRTVTQPVRSGQQIYARGGDLLVLGTVGAGAEVIADGHIHIYGRLRGRALAGAQGDETARVFCQSVEAELVAVAGVYRVNEELDERLRGQAVQAYLKDQKLILEPL